MIKVKNISYQYTGAETPAIESISAEFPRGTISAILGESGSGKTTMLMCLGRFIKPQKGTIELGDDDLYALPELEFRKRLGIVFQKLYLFPHLTVLENLKLAAVHALGQSRHQAQEEGRAMLDHLSISDIVNNYPNQISGGQAQRVAIARALLLKPDYVLLDEPTSALDANTTHEFGQWLCSLKDETNFIVVTHDTLFAKEVASLGFYLSNGKMLDSGNIDKIIHNVHQGQVTDKNSSKGKVYA
ncbi:MAG: amino acid ABC transporter ATP-binding protein [Phycisphaerae bacterium]|jgi:ABC-type polar amino acid transport system ATPase subunit|nr:amino acid ABC transporter ATP-binding protein [Phycisphaerae bacterium]